MNWRRVVLSLPFIFMLASAIRPDPAFGAANPAASPAASPAPAASSRKTIAPTTAPTLKPAAVPSPLKRDRIQVLTSADGRVSALRNLDSAPLRAYAKGLTLAAPSKRMMAATAGSANDPAVIATKFLIKHGSAFGIKNVAAELVMHRDTVDSFGISHENFSQWYKGVPVFGSLIRVTLTNNKVSFVNGSFAGGIKNLDVVPTASGSDALALAREYFAEQYGSDPGEYSEPVLYVFDPAQLDSSRPSAHVLAWKIEVNSRMPIVSRSYFIDAHSGELLYDLDELRKQDCSTATPLYPDPKTPISIYRFIGDCSTSPYVTWCGVGHYLDEYGYPQYGHYRFGRREGQPEEALPHPIKSMCAGETKYDQDIAYDMLPTCHNALWNYPICRRGGNGYGGIGDGGSSWRNPDKTLAWIHQEDAGYNCSVSDGYFQNGSIGFCHCAVAPDLVGHEYAHAVLWFLDWNGSLVPSNITHMNYVGESGALQENYSDVFGEWVEQLYNGSHDWLIGTKSPLGPCRDMRNPRAIPHSPTYPIRYNDPNLSCCAGTSCDMHINANVPNKAAYLMSVGGTFNGCAMRGIGFDKVNAVFFRAADVYYSVNTDFNDAFNALTQACNDLYSEADCRQVISALQAVEMDQAGYCSGIPGLPAACRSCGADLGASCSVGTGACQRIGIKVCADNGVGTICGATAGTPTPEVWDGIDNDCNGVADDGLSVQINDRKVFYNNSSYDGSTPGAGAADDAAAATNKEALVSGPAGCANITGYSKGINGVMFDIVGLTDAGAISVSDFEIKAGNSADPATWSAGPTPAVTVRPLSSYLNRIELIWSDKAIVNQWVKVTVLANAVTGLTANDVFYFGNLVGESGDTCAAVPPTAVVTKGTSAADGGDEYYTLKNTTGFTPVAVTSVYDFNKDRRVNATDVLVSRSNLGASLTMIEVAP